VAKRGILQLNRRAGFFAVLLAAITGMAGAANDAPVPREYFGLHIHRADQGTAWPAVPFGSWRLWDSYVGWAQLEPKNGQWDFTRLDRYVAMAGLTKVDILLPLAMTPRWASARPGEPSAYQPGNVAEPAKLADWTNYVSTVGARYKGKIKHYEVWNEPSDKTHYSGDLATLVKLTCEARRVLKEIDPAIKLVSPASAGGGLHIEFLDKFLAAGGAKCVDIVAHHFYVFKESPEAMIPLIRGVKKLMAANGVGHLPLWNTETGYWIENGDGTKAPESFTRGGWKQLEPTKEAGEYITRAFLVARAEGVDRFFWYAWDNRAMGLIEPSNGQLKPAAAYWKTVTAKLVGATRLKCDHSDGRSTCTFLTENGTPVEYSWGPADK
jgi:hypothetical protein